VSPSKQQGLLPQLGLFTTTMVVVGGVIGSGIFRKPGVMAAELLAQGVGSPMLLVWIWIAAGVITLFGALTNAEIASMIPETGGQYIYFDRMYGPFVAYLYGWAIFAVMMTGSIASVAYVFAEYLTVFIPLPSLGGPLAAWTVAVPLVGDVQPLAQLSVKVVAALMIIGLTVVNYLGARLGGFVQNIFTVAKIAAMAALVLAAVLLPGGQASNLINHSGPITAGPVMPLLLAIAAAMQGAFWAYDGWNNITFIAGEVRRPQRNIPRSLILGLGTVIAIYALINLAYAYVLPIDQMAKSQLVAADVAERLFSGGGRWIAAAVMIATFGCNNGIILSSARVYFSMAQQNVFPRFIGQVHPRYHTPGWSLIVQCVWSVLLLFSGSFDNLTDMLIFVSWIFYALGAYGLFVLRRKEPNASRAYRVPGYPIVPWLFIIAALAFLGLTLYYDVHTYLAARALGAPARLNTLFGVLLVALGTPIYFHYRRRHSR
jgi:basic amino acid/polyamine antiporter, APA family